jgi:integrase/recombinase XerD
MSKLRERMIEDMNLAGLSLRTQHEYIRAVRHLVTCYTMPPDTISEEQVRQYLVNLYHSVARGTFLIKYCGIKFFYYRTLGVAWNLFSKQKVRKPLQKRLPRTINHAEFLRLLSAIQKPDYRLCVHLMYCCGLRISEAVSLPVGNIDSRHMVLRIIGKRNTEHLVPFPAGLLEPMRYFWKTHRNRTWLFPGRFGLSHIPASSLGTAFRMARDTARLPGNVTPHCLRHTYATRLIEMGVDIGVVQMLLRHSSIQSTKVYMHLTEPLRQDIHAKINELFSSSRVKEANNEQ